MSEQHEPTNSVRIDTMDDFQKLPQEVRSALQNVILVTMLAETLDNTTSDETDDDVMVERLTSTLKQQTAVLHNAVLQSPDHFHISDVVIHQVKLQLADAIMSAFITTNQH